MNTTISSSATAKNTPSTATPPRKLRAGFLRRAAAYIIDYCILFVVIMIFFAILGITGAITNPQKGESLGTLVGILSFWIYFSYMESGPRQATFGKRALSIKVVGFDGMAPSFGRATGRHFAKIISGLILGIGFLMCLFTKRKQCLHDLMTDCLVVRDDATVQEVITVIKATAS